MERIKTFVFDVRLKLALLVLKGAYSNIIIQCIGAQETTTINIDEHGNRKNKIVISKTGG